MSAREWKPGDPIPEKYSGMPVTFEWNDVALTSLLRALKNEYQPGYASMCDHVRAAMRSYVPPMPPQPEEPIGLGAVVEDARGLRWLRDHDGFWSSEDGALRWDDLPTLIVRVLSEGVS